MKCPRCDVEMVDGITIYPFEEWNVFYQFRPIANKDNLQLIKCLKCPICGHSEIKND